MTPSWYDVLGLDPSASEEEIRTAWRAAIADRDPTDRRFRSANRAAEVLLDPDRRAEHDAELQGTELEDEDEEPAEAPEEADLAPTAVAPEPEDEAAAETGSEAETEPEGESEPGAEADEEPEPEAKAEPEPEDKPDDGAEAAAPAARTAPRWRRLRPSLGGAVALAAVALVLVVVTVVPLFTSPDAEASGALPDPEEVNQAQAAAEEAVAPVLSYDYRSLEESRQRATSYMTDEQAKRYEKLYEAVIQANAPRTETVVEVELLRSGIVRTGPDRVDVLLFVNRPTSNKQGEVTYRDQATFRMVETGGQWLVGCVITSPDQNCD